MLSRSTGRLLVVFVVLTATCAGAMAPAAVARKSGTHARPLKYACASALYNAKAVLQFTARPSTCRGQGKKLVTFASGRPIYTCRKERGGLRARTSSLFDHAMGIRSRGPAGLMRLVKRLRQCAPPRQPNETPIVLPLKKRHYFCAAKRGGELRWIGDRVPCDAVEFRVVLAKRRFMRMGVLRAVNDRAVTTENKAARLPVLVNDKGRRVVIDRLDASAAVGAVSLAGHRVKYDPARKFEMLRDGQTATDRFRYRLRRGARRSKYATVRVTVRGVNDAPTAVADRATIGKDGLTQIAVLSNDTDAERGAVFPVTLGTRRTRGLVAGLPTGKIVYYPGPAFGSLGPGESATDTFTYRVSDGQKRSRPAKVTVTVTGANTAAPVVTTSSGATAYTENGAPTPVDPGVVVSDADSPRLAAARVRLSEGAQPGDALSFAGQPGITGSYDAAAGVLTLRGVASKADYQTALRSVRYANSGDDPSARRVVEISVYDGTILSAPATKAIALTAVADAPVVTTSSGPVAFTENGAGSSVDPGLTVSDVDSPSLQGATVFIGAGFSAADHDTLTFTDQAGIAGSYDAATGVLSLTGTASTGAYESALRSITFLNTSDNPSTATRTISFAVTDGSASSNTATRDVSVTALNDASTATDQSGLTVNEDSALPIVLGGSDPDNDALTFTHDAASAHGGVISGTGVNLSYAPAADYCGPDSFGFVVDDGHGGTDAGTISVTVACVNDAARVDLDSATSGSDATAAFTEASAAASVAPNAVVSDVDSASLVSATITLTNRPDGAAESLTAVTTGTLIVTAGYDSSTGRLTLSGPDTQANFQKVIRTITYRNTSTTPSRVDRVVSVTVNDGSLDSNAGQSRVSVATHNDAPTATDQGGLTTLEDTALPVTLSGSDPDNDGLTFTHDTQSAHGGVISGTGANVTYSPASDYCGADSFGFVVDDGHGATDAGTISVTVTCVNDAPRVDLNGVSPGTDSTTSFSEGSPAVAVAPSADVSDVDSASLVSATITLTNRPDGTAESLTAVTTGTVIVTAGYDSTTGRLTLSGPDTKANFQKVIRTIAYRNTSLTPSISDRLVSVTVNDGSLDSSARQSRVSVITHNDAPTATDQSGLTVNEDSALAVVLGGSDPDNDGLTFTHDAASAHGGVISGAGASVSYAPAADYCGPDSFGFVVDDGHGATDAGTISVTVACVNDAARVDLNGATSGTDSAASFSEQASHSGGAVQVAPSGTLADVDDTNLASLTVTLTNRPDGTNELVAADLTGTTGITADAYNASTGVLLLHGSASRTDYQKVLRTISYRNDAVSPSTTARNITFVANDGHVNSATATGTVHVTRLLNTPPVVDLDAANAGSADSSATFTEDSPAANIAPNPAVSDTENPTLASATITLTNHPDGALESLGIDASGTSGITVDTYDDTTGVLYLHGAGTLADFKTLISRVKYDNASQNPTTTDRSITVVLSDGTASSTARTATVHVNRHNDAITNSVPGVQSFPENSVFTFSTVNSNRISIADADAGSGAVKVTVSAGHGSLNANIPSGGSRTGDGTHVLELTGTVAAINAVLDGTTYTPDASFAGTDTLTVTSDDQGNTGGSATTDTDTSALSVLAINDAPSNTVPGPQVVDEDAALTFDSGNANLISTSDIDAGSGAIRITVSALHGVITLSGTTGLSFSVGDGTADPTTTFTGTLTNVNSALTGLQYRGTTDYSGPDTLTLVVNDQGNTGTGGAKQDSDTVDITVNTANDPPVATDETFNSTQSAIGNTTLNVNDTASHGGAADGRMATPDPTDTSPVTDRPHKTITGDIIANDTDADNANSALTVVPGTLPTKNATTNVSDGGSVTIQSDGDFNFEPPPGCPTADSYFDYTVSDNVASGNGPKPGTDTGRVTIHSTGCVWYVNNNDAQGNSGTAEQPFDTLAQAEAASSTGNTIYVYDGDDTTTGYNAGISLKASQQLLSEAATLTIGADTLHTADAANKASLANNDADVVSLASGTTVRGFTIDPQGTGGGICGGVACGGNVTAGSTLDDISIVDAGTKGTQAGLELNGSTGTFNISNLIVNNGDGNPATATDQGVKLNNAGTVIFSSLGTTSITTNGAAGLDAAAGGGTTSLGSASVFDDITVTNSGSGGVLLSGTTGLNTVFGDGAGNDLQITTVSGALPAFSAQTTGPFSVLSVGQSDLNATGGPAIDIVGSPGSTMAFDSVSSTNSANDGINLDNLGTGTFSATSGTIGGEAGIGFDVNFGSGSITYPGTFNNGSGPLVAEVTGRTGGVITLSGNISDTSDTGGGVNSVNNTGGSEVYSGATKQFNTGASDAITFSSSDGHTMSFNNGGTDIDTTSGNGVNATASGTLQFTGTGNTIDSTALGAGNRGLNISDTDIAAADATFQRISTSGGINGVRLNNTGTLGNLSITGTGANDSGGTIANTSGNGIELTSTDNFIADELNIQDTATDGIGGPTSGAANVTNFTLTDSTINNAGQSDANVLDSAVGFNNQASANENNLDGNVTITGNTLTNAYGDGVGIFNHNGTISDLQINNNTITSATSAPVGGSGDSDSAGNGIQVVAYGGAGFAASVTKGLVSNNDINNIPDGSGIEFLGGSQGTTVGAMGTPGSSATRIEISGNDIDGASAANPMLTAFITADIEGRGRGNFLIQNNGSAGNQLTNVAGPGIQVGGAGDGGTSTDYEVHVLNNYLTPNSSAGASGIGLGTDVDAIADSSVLSDFDVNAEIANNYVNDSSGAGIRVLHRDANDALNLKVNNNTVDSPLQSGNYGIRIDHGSSGSASFNPSICMQMSGNDADASGADGFGDTRTGIGILKRGAAATYDFGIVGLSPTPATNAQTETYLAGLNIGSLGAGAAVFSGKEVAVQVGTDDFRSCVLPAF